ncbi:hypothetical protein HPB50_026069 [Hyalomma asiaticum]|uniref:Uncharacterized protein n=1 Tax=Hyalomma asiaticum TaxID=266040 RepID=A0ACB7T4R6_HYAAI|nr:hypothetical protein HPB50_026069 [Hyalomma asiaticum]
MRLFPLPLVIAGDLNAPNTEWGHSYNTAKGTRLANLAAELGLTLITDPRFPTRRGDSVQRDTTPDLTYLKNTDGSWDNLTEDLGSDHYILEIVTEAKLPPTNKHRFVDWDLFRRIRKEEANSEESYAELIPHLQLAVEKATKEIETQIEVPKMDSRLAHMLEAKNALLGRWRTHRLKQAATSQNIRAQ